MLVFPAIDIKDDKCVNLKQGKFEEITVYNDDPVAAAIDWLTMGAKRIHIVDLDGARYGTERSNRIVSVIAKTVGIPIQIGGGIRSMKDIEEKLKCGVRRVILGTAAFEDEAFLKEAVGEYGDMVAVGIDAAGGLVKTNGWLNDTGVSAVELCERILSVGVKTIIYTDILKDGMMSGVNIHATKELIDKTNGKAGIIASGGVSSMADLEEVRAISAKGVIIGKAIYNGALDLGEVLKEFDEPGF